MIARRSARRARMPAAPSEDGELREGGLSVEAIVGGAHGLHARPATAFVEAAKGFDVEVDRAAWRQAGQRQEPGRRC